MNTTLQKAFSKLRDRIVKHRKNCKKWQDGKQCFDCHRNTLTSIEKEVYEFD